MNSFTATCVLLDTKHDIQRATGETQNDLRLTKLSLQGRQGNTQNYHTKAERETSMIAHYLNIGYRLLLISATTGVHGTTLHLRAYLLKIQHAYHELNAVSNKYLPDNRVQLNMNEKW